MRSPAVSAAMRPDGAGKTQHPFALWTTDDRQRRERSPGGFWSSVNSCPQGCACPGGPAAHSPAGVRRVAGSRARAAQASRRWSRQAAAPSSSAAHTQHAEPLPQLEWLALLGAYARPTFHPTWDATLQPIRQAYLNGLISSRQRATIISLDSLMLSGGGVWAQPVLGRAADAWATLPRTSSRQASPRSPCRSWRCRDARTPPRTRSKRPSWRTPRRLPNNRVAAAAHRFAPHDTTVWVPHGTARLGRGRLYVLATSSSSLGASRGR